MRRSQRVVIHSLFRSNKRGGAWVFVAVVRRYGDPQDSFRAHRPSHFAAVVSFQTEAELEVRVAKLRYMNRTGCKYADEILAQGRSALEAA